MSNIDPDALLGYFATRMKFPAAEGTRIEVPVGVDDCAVIKLGNEYLVTTSDYVNASPMGLELGISTYADIGYYLVAANLSDLLGTGARPIGLMINIMWHRDLTTTQFDTLMDGIAEAAQEFGVPVLGGDTKLSAKASAFCATAIGTVDDESELFLQTRAHPGDDVWVSGPLGSCGAAVLGLSEGFGDEQWKQWAKTAITKPILPFARSRRVAGLRLRAAGTDLSDGLGADLARLCLNSHVGAEIQISDIPCSREVETLAKHLNIHPAAFAFTVGGDLQFLVTASRDSAKLEALGMTRIGKITSTGLRACMKDGRAFDMPTGGHRDAKKMMFADEVAALIREFGER